MPVVETTAGAIWIEDNRHDTSSVVTLMLHGAGGSHLHFPPQIRTLPQANAIIPDLSGHASSKGTPRTTIPDYAADMLALLDALHIDNAIIAGHSMGGAIALHMALTYPQRVRGLILISTGAKLSVHPDILGGVLTEFTQTARALMDWQWHPYAQTDLREVIGYKTLIETPASVVYGDYMACNAFDVRARLSEINIPTLIISGTYDKLTPPKYSEYLHQHIAGSKLVLIDNGAHMVAHEQPQLIATTLNNWLLSTTF
jgi:pimeloyl-ACP methyl ester carboxylesterase